MARLLTDKEIQNMLDFIKLNTKLPPETAKSIVNNHKNRIIKQLKNQKIYPELIPELKKQLEVNYIKSIISPGESIGILAAQSIGERQTQNSIDYDEEIVIDYYGEIKKLKIGYFIDEYINTIGSIKIDEHSEVQKCENIYIQSITNDEKIEWKSISEVSRHAPKGDLIKVTTESGRSVISTLSHSHLKKYKRKVVPVLGSELKLGDRIPVIKGSAFPHYYKTKKIDITDYVKYDRIGPYQYDSDGNTPLNSPNNSSKSDEYIFMYNERINRYIDVDKTFICFLGILLSNNCEINYETINIHCDKYDEDMYNKIKILCCKYSILLDIKQPHKYFFQFLKKDSPVIYTIRSYIFTNFIKNLTDNCNNIPAFIFKDKDQIWLFLNTFFINGGFSRVSEINKEISFLLTYFGIYSRIIKDTLYIQKKYIDIFLNMFGLHININNLEDNFHSLDDKELNEEATRLLYNFHDEYNENKAKNIEIIPEMEIKKINTYTELDIFISEYIIKACNHNEHNEEFFDISDNLEYLYQVYSAHVVWEKIIKMELIFEKDYKHPYVYDFTVPGTESFALFSGIVVHNTLNSVDWKEKILYMKYNVAYIEPIGKMIDNLLLKEPEKIVKIEENRTDYLKLDDGYYIPSCDEYGKTGWYKIEAITKHLPVGDLVEVTTESGRNVIATQSKSFLVWNEEENKFIATQGCDVKIGDILPTTESLPRFCDVFTENVEYKGTKIKIDIETCYIIGLYLTNNIQTLLLEKDIKERYDKWFLNSKLDEKFVEYVTNYNSSVPNFIFTSSTDCIKGFLSGYFRSCIYENGNIKICSNNDEVLISINFLLSYFAIFSYIESNILIIKSEYIESFEKYIVEEIRKDPETNVFNSFVEASETLNITKTCIQSCIYGRQKTSFGYVWKLEENNIDEELVINRGKHNVYFDKVLKINYTKGSTDYVYDLTVEKTRNFQLFNGLNVRDTLNKGKLYKNIASIYIKYATQSNCGEILLCL